MIDLHLAKECCEASMRAYDIMAGIGEEEAGQKFILEPLKNPTSAALIIEEVDKRILVFPGTLSEFARPSITHRLVTRTWKDWLKNVQIEMTQTHRGMVHRGFLAEYRLVEGHVLRTLFDWASAAGDKPLYLTGHSQGAAIAQIAAVMLPLQGVKVHGVYSFAAPRPGNKAFVSAVECEVHRFEYGADIVPHVPFDIDLGFPFNHMNVDFEPMGALCYGRPNSATVFDMSKHTEELLMSHRKTRILSDRKLWIEHHHLPHYLKMIEGAL